VYFYSGLLDNSDMFDDWWQQRAVFRVTDSPMEPLAPLDVSSPSIVPPEADGAVFVVPPGPDPGHGFVGEFLIFPTASYDSLVYGDRVDLEDNMTVDGVRNRILSVLRGRPGASVPADVELLVHLPGGLPFLGGMLRDYSEACFGRVRKHRIYAVLARPLCGAGREVIREVSDVSAQNARLHLSSLFDSSQRGFMNIALLLWYFQHDGPKTKKMLLALGRVTCFAPLMTNLDRFLEG
jgi:hypothetical protein